MSNLIYARLFYQSDEEVLETGATYFDLSVPAAIDLQASQQLANEIADAAQTDWSSIFAKDVMLWGVQVEVPNQTATTIGPYRYQTVRSFASVALLRHLPDSVVIRATFGGMNTDNEPVRGGQRWSGFPTDKVDCNVIATNFLTQFGDFVDAVFKPEWVLSGGERFTRVVLSKPNTINEEIVPVADTDIPPRVTTRQDRVMNKPNRGRKKPEENGNGPV